jgi:hypothetical protein
MPFHVFPLEVMTMAAALPMRQNTQLQQWPKAQIGVFVAPVARL